MVWLSLRSKAIRLFYYDQEERRLILRFGGGVFYVYDGVDEVIADLVRESPAPGAMIRDMIKPMPYTLRTKGSASVETVLFEARTNGMKSLRHVFWGQAWSLPGRVGEKSDLAASLECDSDCRGDHAWLAVPIIGNSDTTVSYQLWHVNNDTGLVVPPEPYILSSEATSRVYLSPSAA